MQFVDVDYPAEPYPGARPGVSFVHEDGVGRALEHDGEQWRVTSGAALGEWLAERAAPPEADRLPVLAYGSNACPSKITWLREELGLRGPVVVLRATCHGLAAVWAAGLRVVDDQRAATLAAMPEVIEEHAVWLATMDQLAVLDRCEGRGVRYDLARLRTGRVVLETGEQVARAARLRRSLRAADAATRRRASCSDAQTSPSMSRATSSGAGAVSDGLVRDVVPAQPP